MRIGGKFVVSGVLLVAAMTTWLAHRAQPTRAQTQQYIVVEVAGSAANLQETLNNHAAQGWRLVQVVPTGFTNSGLVIFAH